MQKYINGYGLSNEEYSLLVNKLYGVEEYYYYKNNNYYNDYLYIINELDKIKRNIPMDECYKNAIIGWYIFFKNSKRDLQHSHMCVRITDACQLRCKHCYQQQTVKNNKHMTFDEFVYLYYKHQDIAKKFVHYKEDFIHSCDLEGGETTLNPDLYKIIRFLNSNNVYVAVLSNGIDIKDELIDTLKLHKKNKVQVSIDGLEKTHDFIRGEGTFKKSIEGIKKLLSNNINVSSNMVVHEQNFNDVPNVKEYIKSIGCKRTGCMLYTPQDNNFLNFLNKENLEIYMKDYKPATSSCNGTFKCNVGNQSVIREDGGFLFCGRGYDEPVANYFTDSDDVILYNMKTFTIRYRSVPVYCFNCAKVSSCLGGSMCNSSHQNGICVFNTEDRICHVLDNKVVGDMYDIQTIL